MPTPAPTPIPISVPAGNPFDMAAVLEASVRLVLMGAGGALVGTLVGAGVALEGAANGITIDAEFVDVVDVVVAAELAMVLEVVTAAA